MATTGSGSPQSRARGRPATSSCDRSRKWAAKTRVAPRRVRSSAERSASDSSADQSNLGRRLARPVRTIEPVTHQPQGLGRGAADHLRLVAQASDQARDRRVRRRHVPAPGKRPRATRGDSWPSCVIICRSRSASGASQIRSRSRISFAGRIGAKRPPAAARAGHSSLADGLAIGIKR